MDTNGRLAAFPVEEDRSCRHQVELADARAKASAEGVHNWIERSVLATWIDVGAPQHPSRAELLWNAGVVGDAKGGMRLELKGREPRRPSEDVREAVQYGFGAWGDGDQTVDTNAFDQRRQVSCRGRPLFLSCTDMRGRPMPGKGIAISKRYPRVRRATYEPNVSASTTICPARRRTISEYRISVAGACHARHTSGSDFFVRRHCRSQDDLGPWIIEGSYSCGRGMLLVKISKRISCGKAAAVQNLGGAS